MSDFFSSFDQTLVIPKVWDQEQHLAKPRRDRSQIRRNIFEIRRLYDFWVEGRGAIGKPPWFPKDPTHQNPKNLKLHKNCQYILYQSEKTWLVHQVRKISTREDAKTRIRHASGWIPKSGLRLDAFHQDQLVI